MAHLNAIEDTIFQALVTVLRRQKLPRNDLCGAMFTVERPHNAGRRELDALVVTVTRAGSGNHQVAAQLHRRLSQYMPQPVEHDGDKVIIRNLIQ